MHTDLSSHLHSSECNQLVDELNSCHSENLFGKFLGACNSIDTKLVNCLHQERVKRAAQNRAKARERIQTLREKLQSLP